MNSTSSIDKPCNASNYYWDNRPQNVPESWTWFECKSTQKCIHMDSRCDMHPHTDCIYEKDGILVAEDEEGCFHEYKRKNLISKKAANIICYSPDHNTMSLAYISE